MTDGTHNPRFVIWAESVGVSPEDLLLPARKGGTSQIDGTPWTVLFIIWIQNRWRDWATELGYRDPRNALADGHTHADFDAWLEARR